MCILFILFFSSSLRLFFLYFTSKHIKITSSIDSIQSQTVTVEFKTEKRKKEKKILKKSFGAKMLSKETLKKFHIGKKTINIFQIEYYFERLRCTQYASRTSWTFFLNFISLKECQLAPFRFLLESTKNEKKRRFVIGKEETIFGCILIFQLSKSEHMRFPFILYSFHFHLLIRIFRYSSSSYYFILFLDTFVEVSH